ncbi:unnamed protein product [Brassicogethes aeneus]|uniref:DUF4806 domain-containing protein n=1 Tax=Brassicogethes aeneus TaxID=1431903 RepID=A0A9P0FLK3_BRAAE|nr:unnamed protein product [Brassicogethes aeneus]
MPKEVSSRHRNRLLQKMVNTTISEINKEAMLRVNTATTSSLSSEIFSRNTVSNEDRSESDSLSSNNEQPDLLDIPNNWISSDDDYDMHDGEDNGSTNILDDVMQETEETAGLTLTEKLCTWATEENICQTKLKKLLDILKAETDLEAFKDLPKDPRTLLQTPRKSLVKTLDNGNFHYFGITNSLNNFLRQCNYVVSKKDKIELIVNIDGLPLNLSSTSSLWPILIRVDSLEKLKNYVVMVGAFHGYAKPSSSNNYLKEFINECSELTTNGILIQNNNLEFRVKMFVCDVPAKSFILNVKGHTSENGCTKCHEASKRVNYVMCYENIENLQLRTDAEFRLNLDQNHHVGSTLLMELPKFDLIKDIPLDYMHLVCLGVVKRLICNKTFGWVSGKRPFKLSATQIQQISQHITLIRQFIPVEFSHRKCRGLDNCARFNAAEFRLLLLYTGPVVFKNFLKADFYYNFLCLHVAIRILCNVDLSNDPKFVEYARELIKSFVKNSGKIYGPDFVSFNVHGLLHLVNDVERFGTLDNFSAFPFENHMQSIKKMIRKSEKPLQQIINRVSESVSTRIYLSNEEKISFLHQHTGGPLLDRCCSPQYKCLKIKSLTFKVNEADCFAILENNSIIKIINFATLDNEVCALGQAFRRTSPFFNKPCSSEELQIFLINNDLSPLKVYCLSKIKNKMIVLPYVDEQFTGYTTMWSVVYFVDDETFEVVPNFWVAKEDDRCSFPHYQAYKLYETIRKRKSPETNWNIYKIQHLATYSDFNVAQDQCDNARNGKELMAEEIEKVEEKPKGKGYRKRLCNKNLTDFTVLNSTEDEEEDFSLKLPSLNRKVNKDDAKTIGSSAETILSKIDFGLGSQTMAPASTKIIAVREHHNKQEECPIEITGIENLNSLQYEQDTLELIKKKIDEMDAKNEEFQRRVFRILFTIEKKLNDLEKTAIANPQRADVSANDEPDDFREICELFPIDSPEKLQVIEESLEDANLRTKLAKRFSMVGGEAPKEVTRSVLYLMVTNKLAAQYSFDGGRGKLKFKNLKLFQLLLDSVRANTKTKEATTADILKELRQWLAQAPFRKNEK